MSLTSVEKLDNFPGDMTAADLDFSALLAQMVGDDVYIAAGTMSAADLATLTDQTDWDEALDASFDVLGELAEDASKIESKVTKLKTRNYQIPGRRNTPIELNIAGLGQAQKAFLESNDFTGSTVTIVLRNREKDTVIVYNGLRWSAEWMGEVDSLFKVTLSTEFIGTTNDKILVIQDIPVTST